MSDFPIIPLTTLRLSGSRLCDYDRAAEPPSWKNGGFFSDDLIGVSGAVVLAGVCAEKCTFKHCFYKALKTLKIICNSLLTSKDI